MPRGPGVPPAHSGRWTRRRCGLRVLRAGRFPVCSRKTVGAIGCCSSGAIPFSCLLNMTILFSFPADPAVYFMESWRCV